MGIYLYMNGAIANKEKLPRYLIRDYKQPVDRLTIGCDVFKSNCGKFYLSMLTFSPYFTSIDELMKFSLPLKVLPTFDWFLMLIHNGTTMTTPALHVHNDVKQTDNGLSFDGKTGWLSTDTLGGIFNFHVDK